MQIPEFQKNGKFDPERYQRLLAANHLTPSIFETMQARELLSVKARDIVSNAVALTPSELAEAQALMLRQTESRSGQSCRGKGTNHARRPVSKAATRADGLRRIA